MFGRLGSALILALACAVPASAQQWANKMFQTTTHDFGYVAKGAKVQFQFPVTNRYVEDVHVMSVRSSCGCTQPTISKPSLKTYQTGAIVATINTQAFQGQRGATVTVTFDKPFYAEVQLHVSVYIRSDVVFTPGSVDFGSVDEGARAEKNVVVAYSGRDDWKILEVRSDNPHLAGEVVGASRSGGQAQYTLAVHLDEKAPAGFLRDHLVLVTNDRRSAQVPLAVDAKVEPALSVSPSSLFLGPVQPGQTVTKQLIVRAKKPFKILSVKCDDPSFTFDISNLSEAKTLHVVPVTFAAGESTGKVMQSIRIETDLGDTPPVLSAVADVAR